MPARVRERALLAKSSRFTHERAARQSTPRRSFSFPLVVVAPAAQRRRAATAPRGAGEVAAAVVFAPLSDAGKRG